MDKKMLIDFLNNKPIHVDISWINKRLKEIDDQIRLACSLIKKEVSGDLFPSEWITYDFVRKRIRMRIQEFNNASFGNSHDNLSFLTLIDSPLTELPPVYENFEVNIREKESYEYVLRHVTNHSIRPIFKIDSADRVVATKPSLPFTTNDLQSMFQCKSYPFDNLTQAIKAIENAKPDSEIITVIDKTVYYRRP